jgi:Protein of unknown function (DUF1460)
MQYMAQPESQSIVDPSRRDPVGASTIKVPIGQDLALGEVEVALDLGSWTIARIEALQHQLSTSAADRCDRVARWASVFTGTPFRYECRGLKLGQNQVLARLASFDCITYVYNVVALAAAQSFSEFVLALASLRYRDFPATHPSNRRIAGSFFDYACEAFLVNAPQYVALRDVTADVALNGASMECTIELSPLRRDWFNDPERSIVYPRFPRRKLRTCYLDTKRKRFIRPGTMRDGDIVLFTNVPSDASARTLVKHAGIAMHVDGIPSMMHASRHYLCGNVGAARAGGPVEEGWHPGVHHLCEFLGEHSLREVGGVKYYGYDAKKVRSLELYANQNFSGMKVLRLE